MYLRHLSPTLEKFAKLYPVIGITGPRQSGKTTLTKMLFHHMPYVSLENLDTRAIAKGDPRDFLKNYNKGAIFDEIQHVPELLSYLQEIVDASSINGNYILTGSQNFSLNHHIAQSLAGRVGMTTLLPLSISELNSNASVYTNIFKGGYPRLYKININPIDFYPSYIQTYIERDIRQFKNIENLSLFQNFLKLCAGRIGQIMNFSSLAQDCGISHATARNWLNLLEVSYIIFFLQPFYKNLNKRIIKMPKLYFYDTGLACTLLGIEKEEQIRTHYMQGALYENLVILEILKKRINNGLPANLYFWRDKTGYEIDCIAEWGGNIKAIEIKMGATFQKDFIKNIKYFKKLASDVQGHLIYNGTQEGKFLDVSLVPFQKIDDILCNNEGS